MPHLEPTYLRYIYDGLIKGSIHPENAAELPEGLIGLYEEAFDERQPVHKRQQLLERFAIWALLKKEVSANFVAEVLNQPEAEIQEFISTYSAWFNSPEIGKYQLYHERLKVYLLQKLSEEEVNELHEKLISRLEQAIEEQKADEFEWYGLEFLTRHLSSAAMLNGDGKKLIELAYSRTHWQRQLKISKGYTWTKNGLKAVMSWASKYNDDEVIECGLQMVDLHHQEQNAAPQIVALVAEGEFDAALQRIAQFGGSDKEGLQRKFILYMLCLMELTLLDSKDKPFRREGIEKLLKHLDEQLPEDHSVLNWGEFFPGNLMYEIVLSVYNLGLNHHVLFSRTDSFDSDWILSYIDNGGIQIDLMTSFYNEIYNELSFSVYLANLCKIFDEIGDSRKVGEFLKKLDKTLHKIKDSAIKNYAYYKICPILASTEYVQTSIEFALNIDDDLYKCCTYAEMSSQLFSLNEFNIAEELMLLAIEFTSKLTFDSISHAYSILSTNIYKQGKEQLASEIAEKAYRFAFKLKNPIIKSRALNNYFIERCLQGRIDEVKSYLDTVEDDHFSDELLKEISVYYCKQGQYFESMEIIKKINYSKEDQNFAKSFLIEEFTRKGVIRKAFDYLKTDLSVNIYQDNSEIKDLKEKLSIELIKKGKFSNAFMCADNNQLIIQQIFVECSLLGDEKKSKKALKLLMDSFYKCQAIIEKSKKLVQSNKIKEAILNLDRAIKINHKIEDLYWKENLLGEIAFQLSIVNQENRALKIIRKITDNGLRDLYLVEIIKVALKQKNDFELAKQYNILIYNNFYKSLSLIYFSTYYFNNNEVESSELYISNAFQLAESLEDELFDLILSEYSNELSNQKKFIKCLDFLKKIKSEDTLCQAIQEISEHQLLIDNFQGIEDLISLLRKTQLRNSVISNLAEKTYQIHGFNKGLKYINEIKAANLQEELKNKFFCAISNDISASDQFIQFLKIPNLENVLIRKLLCYLILHDLFMNDKTINEINHHFEILPIQWAINLKKQLN